MPPILAVTFDCAHTLVQVRWTPSGYAIDCAEAIGLELDRQVATETYNRLVGGRWKQYQQINTSRDRAQTQDWWRELTQDWLTQLDLDPLHTEPLMEHSEGRLTNPDYGYFEPYPETVEALTTLNAMKMPIGVISNWDISLGAVLEGYGLHSYFDFVLASLVEGFEKPDPRLFQLALDHLKFAPENVLHVGDNPIDDIEGARRCGMQTLLIDRELRQREGNRTPTLLDVLALIEESQS